jgi:hypothetical protein
LGYFKGDKNMKRKLVVMVRGGVVNEVLANTDDVEVDVFDLDNMEYEDDGGETLEESYNKLKQQFQYQVF